MSELHVPKRILQVPAIPLLGSGKTDYPAVQALVAAAGRVVSRSVFVLLGAQFLSALADNAILFTAIAMLIGAPRGAWYVPALQSGFLVAFVLLAPWVGTFADTRAKPQVLLIGNVLKAAGAGLMLAGLEPIAAYALVGVGAAVYGPAKYGILPELVSTIRSCVRMGSSKARRSSRSSSAR